MLMKVSKNSSSKIADLGYFLACHVMILSWATTTHGSHWILPCYFIIKQLTNDLLTISVTFTWFHKFENIVI